VVPGITFMPRQLGRMLTSGGQVRAQPADSLRYQGFRSASFASDA